MVRSPWRSAAPRDKTPTGNLLFNAAEGVPVSPHVRNDARFYLRLSADHKAVIEEAATTLGQSVSDFAISTLVHTARSVLQQRSVTELTVRDRNLFIALLDDARERPNMVLADAARRYKNHRGM